MVNKNVDLRVEYKKPLEIDYLESAELILERVIEAIEESPPQLP